MKVIFENETKLVKFLLDDAVDVAMNADHIMLYKDGAEYLKVPVLNASDSTVVNGVEDTTENWMGNK